jgi:hypothetical protein
MLVSGKTGLGPTTPREPMSIAEGLVSSRLTAWPSRSHVTVSSTLLDLNEYHRLPAATTDKSVRQGLLPGCHSDHRIVLITIHSSLGTRVIGIGVVGQAWDPCVTGRHRMVEVDLDKPVASHFRASRGHNIIPPKRAMLIEHGLPLSRTLKDGSRHLLPCRFRVERRSVDGDYNVLRLSSVGLHTKAVDGGISDFEFHDITGVDESGHCLRRMDQTGHPIRQGAERA